MRSSPSSQCQFQLKRARRGLGMQMTMHAPLKRNILGFFFVPKVFSTAMPCLRCAIGIAGKLACVHINVMCGVNDCFNVVRMWHTLWIMVTSTRPF